MATRRYAHQKSETSHMNFKAYSLALALASVPATAFAQSAPPGAVPQTRSSGGARAHTCGLRRRRAEVLRQRRARQGGHAQLSRGQRNAVVGRLQGGQGRARRRPGQREGLSLPNLGRKKAGTGLPRAGPFAFHAQELPLQVAAAAKVIPSSDRQVWGRCTSRAPGMPGTERIAGIGPTVCSSLSRFRARPSSVHDKVRRRGGRPLPSRE